MYTATTTAHYTPIMATKLPKIVKAPEEDKGKKIVRPKTGTKQTADDGPSVEWPLTHRLRLKVMKDQYGFIFQETNWTDERMRRLKKLHGIKFGLRQEELSRRWAIIFESCEKSEDPFTVLHIWNECCSHKPRIKKKLGHLLQEEIENHIRPLYFYKAIGPKARDDVARFIVKNVDQVTATVDTYYKEMNASFIAANQYMEKIAVQMHEIPEGKDEEYEPPEDIETLYKDVKDSMNNIVAVIDSLNTTVKDKNKEISDLRSQIKEKSEKLEKERDHYKKKAEKAQGSLDLAVQRLMAPYLSKLDKLDKLDEIDKLSKDVSAMKGQLSKLHREPGDPQLKDQYNKRKLKPGKVHSMMKNPDQTQI